MFKISRKKKEMKQWKKIFVLGYAVLCGSSIMSADFIPEPGVFYTIKNKQTHKVLAEVWGTGAPIETGPIDVEFYNDDSTYRDHPTRVFQFVAAGDDYFLIKNKAKGRVLNVINADSEANPLRVLNYTDNGDSKTHRTFQFVAAGNGYFLIRNKAKGKILKVDVVHGEGSIPVKAWDDDGLVSPYSLFLFERQ